MKRGKTPPIEIKFKLSKAERLHQKVFKVKVKPEPTAWQRSWLQKNCLVCEHRNAERIVANVLADTEHDWKHVCCFPGVTGLNAKNSMCINLKTSSESSLKKS